MSEARVNGGNSLPASLVLLPPSLEDPRVWSGPIRHACRMGFVHFEYAGPQAPYW